MTGLKVCIMTILLTLIYLTSSVFVSTIIFNHNATGSLIKSNNKIIGSKLIGQEFTSPLYFHNRPSINNYKNNISGNTNYGYYSKKLVDDIKRNYTNHKIKNFNATPDLNLISESASGLDPDITYEGALSQVERISKLSGTNKNELIKLLDKKAKPLACGILGQKIINVLELNLELKQTYAKTHWSRRIIKTNS